MGNREDLQCEMYQSLINVVCDLLGCYKSFAVILGRTNPCYEKENSIIHVIS